MTLHPQAERFAEAFRAVYLTFHRRDGPRSELAGAFRAVLGHLALAGPLTVGEAALHLRRAQSVVSEIVAHLQHQGLTRMPPGAAEELIDGLPALAASKGEPDDV
jgi:hypothetical protein